MKFLTRLAVLLMFCAGAVLAEPGNEADQVFQQLQTLEADIARFSASLESSTQERKRIIETRLERAEQEHTRVLHAFAETVLAPDAAPLTPSQEARFKGYLAAKPAFILVSLNRLTQDLKLPPGDLSAEDLASQTSRLEQLLARAGRTYESLFLNKELSQLAGMDIEAEEARLLNSTHERAENASAYLSLVMKDGSALKSEVALMPENPDLKSLYRVHKKLLEVVVAELEVVTEYLEALGVTDTTFYRSQIVTASGSLSQDIFNVGVFSTLMGNWTEYLAGWIGSNGVEIVFNLLTFIIILVVARLLSQWLKRAVEKALAMSTAKLSTLLKRMIVSTAASSVYIIGLLIGFSQIGFSLGPLLAGLGIAGFVIGFALQDTLANFASGLMILFYRPFDVGDLIESGGVFGTVSQMSLVNTTILTLDNQTLIVPNSKIWGDVIKNVTAQQERRVDLLFGIGYNDDLEKAEAIIWETLNSDERILDDPAPLVKLHELGESSVNIVVRAWVKTGDYWNVYWDVTRSVKTGFDQQGISIPFPQRDVHVYQHD